MRRRPYARKPGWGLLLHISLQAFSACGLAAVLDLYLHDVLELSDANTKVATAVCGGVLPGLFGLAGGIYADARIGVWRGQRIAFGFWVMGTLLLLLSTFPSDILTTSLGAKRILGLAGTSFAACGAGIMLPCLVTFVGDQHVLWSGAAPPQQGQVQKGGWCCCFYKCCCRRRQFRTRRSLSSNIDEMALESVVTNPARSDDEYEDEDDEADHNANDSFDQQIDQGSSNINTSEGRLLRASAEGSLLIYCFWASVGALLGDITFRMATHRLSTAVADLTSYPVMGGCQSGQRHPIQCINDGVGGTLTVAEIETGIEIFGKITGNGMSYGGIHIHSGFRCDDDHIGTHYHSNSPHTDPWANAMYEVEADEHTEVNIYMKQKLFTLAEEYPVEGRVIVMHDQDGSRISCGKIATQWHRYKWSLISILLFVVQIIGSMAFQSGGRRYRFSKRRRYNDAGRGAMFTASERSDLIWIMPTLLPLPFFWAVYAQQVLMWKEQARHLDTSWFPFLDRIPQSWQLPDAMGTFRRLVVVLLVFLYKILLFPALNGVRVVICNRGLWAKERALDSSNIGKWYCFGSALSRIVWGFVCLLAAIVSAERLQKEIDARPQYEDDLYDDDDDNVYTPTINVKYQLAQTIFLGLSEVLVVTAGITYCYDEMEPSLRATMEGVWVALWIGQLLGSLTYEVYPSLLVGFDASAVTIAVVILWFGFHAYNHTPKAERLSRARIIAEASDHMPEDHLLLEDPSRYRRAPGTLEEEESDSDDDFVFGVGDFYGNSTDITGDSRNFDFQFDPAPLDREGDPSSEVLEVDASHVSLAVQAEEVGRSRGGKTNPKRMPNRKKSSSRGRGVVGSSKSTKRDAEEEESDAYDGEPGVYLK